MKITWYGHSCFKVDTAGGSVVFDPYEPDSVPGLRLPELTAEKVICSHDHHDHGWAAGVRLSGKTLDGVRFLQIASFHDEKQGALRGMNTITAMDAEGLRLVHLGDLGHRLSAEQLSALGKVDILLLPVGGYFTIGPETARQVAEDIGASIVIPMHYRGKGFGYDVIAPVEDYLTLADHVRRLEDNSLDPAAIETPVTAVLRCPAGE